MPSPYTYEASDNDDDDDDDEPVRARLKKPFCRVPVESNFPRSLAFWFV